jgi:ribosome-associated protein
MMKNDLPIKNGIVIPYHELEITSSRAGGPGGQHVNKTNSRITVRWNIQTTNALNDEQKARVIQNLAPLLTSEGDLIVHSSSSRSQQQNKDMAFASLAAKVRQALHIPKKRMATRVSKAAQKARLDEKSHRGSIKKMRGKRHFDE